MRRPWLHATTHDVSTTRKCSREEEWSPLRGSKRRTLGQTQASPSAGLRAPRLRQQTTNAAAWAKIAWLQHSSMQWQPTCQQSRTGGARRRPYQQRPATARDEFVDPAGKFWGDTAEKPALVDELHTWAEGKIDVDRKMERAMTATATSQGMR